MTAVPFACPAMPMYAIWHQRYQYDPLHRWLREALSGVTPPGHEEVPQRLERPLANPD